MKKIKQFLIILFLGQPNARPENKLNPAIKNQWLNVKRVWDNKHNKDFGLERIVRLLVAVLLFVFPGLYIRHFFGKFGLIWRKLGVELYVIIKLVLPIMFFKLNLTGNPIVLIVTIIMAVETLIYLISLIFLSNEFAKPISYRRSLITVFINYIEVCLEYAVIYSYCNYHIPGFFNEKLTTNIQAIYFSFSTSATVGYGDIVTTNPIGERLVISQIILFLLFFGLFISFFASRVHDATYYNTKVNYPKGKWQRPITED